MIKKSIVLLVFSVMLVGCGKNTMTESSSVPTATSTSQTKEQVALNVYIPEYNLEEKTFVISGVTYEGNKLTAKKEGVDVGEVKVSASGSISYLGKLEADSYEIVFSDGKDFQTISIKSIPQLEKENADKRAEIERVEKEETAAREKIEQEAAEKAAKEKEISEQVKKNEEAAKKEAEDRKQADDALRKSQESAKNASREHRNALGKAKEYLSFTSFSKSGLYKQLQYEGFPDDSCQFAIDNIVTDWNKNALKTAENYLSFSSFSDQGLYEQLIYEGFSEEQAQYAIDNLPK